MIPGIDNPKFKAEAKKTQQDTPNEAGQRASDKKPHGQPASLEELFRGYTVKRDYVEGLGKEEWLYKNLIIRGHVVIICAKSGGGKTTFFMKDVIPGMVKDGAQVVLIDCDSPASEHKAMKDIADDVGFMFLNPATRRGKSAETFIKELRATVEAGEEMSGTVFVFDTLKKFADLMSKSSVKTLMSLARNMCSLGATVVFLAHANKYRDADGNLVPEGVNDVKSDTDELIIFERQKAKSGRGIDVTSVVDADKNAKVRGLFKPFSFHISEEREVTFYNDPLDLVDRTMTSAEMATDEEILDAAEEYLRDLGDKGDLKKNLANHVYDVLTKQAGLKRIKGVLAQNVDKFVDGATTNKRFVYKTGDRNGMVYTMAPSAKEQKALWIESAGKELNGVGKKVGGA